MLILQSNCSPELPLETMHCFLRISEELQVISFAEDFDKLRKLIGEECEYRVIPVLLDIRSNDDAAKEMFAALPFVNHVINFDGRDFVELVPSIGKDYKIDSPININVTRGNVSTTLWSLLEQMKELGTRGRLFNMTTNEENRFTRLGRSLSFRRKNPRAQTPRPLPETRTETRNMMFKTNQEISKTLKEYYRSKMAGMKAKYNLEVERINKEDRKSREQIQEEFARSSSIESQRRTGSAAYKAKRKQELEEMATRVLEEQKRAVGAKFEEAMNELYVYRKRMEQECYYIVCREVVDILETKRM